MSGLIRTQPRSSYTPMVLCQQQVRPSLKAVPLERRPPPPFVEAIASRYEVGGAHIQCHSTLTEMKVTPRELHIESLYFL